ncbi:hypothetical protein D3C78_1375470 [compost metagenome]
MTSHPVTSGQQAAHLDILTAERGRNDEVPYWRIAERISVRARWIALQIHQAVMEPVGPIVNHHIRQTTLQEVTGGRDLAIPANACGWDQVIAHHLVLRAYGQENAGNWNGLRILLGVNSSVTRWPSRLKVA